MTSNTDLICYVSEVYMRSYQLASGCGVSMQNVDYPWEMRLQHPRILLKLTYASVTLVFQNSNCLTCVCLPIRSWCMWELFLLFVLCFIARSKFSVVPLNWYIGYLNCLRQNVDLHEVDRSYSTYIATISRTSYFACAIRITIQIDEL